MTRKDAAYVNYNYTHKGYEKVSGVKEYTKEGKIEVGKLIGVKYIHKIAADKKSTYMALYINTDPIDLATGKFKNEGWKLKADYLAKGISQYQNIPPVWGGDSYLRVDGYDGVTLYAYSQREIDTEAKSQVAEQLMTVAAPQAVEAPVPEDKFEEYESPNEEADKDQ